MNFSKKSIGPVVATGLFIVVAIVATISFQVWMQDYSSQVFSDIESSSFSYDIGVEDFQEGDLLIFNRGDDEVSSLNLYIDGVECNEELYLDRGLNRIDIKDCLDRDMEGVKEIHIEKGEEFFSNNILMDESEIDTLFLGDSKELRISDFEENYVTTQELNIEDEILSFKENLESFRGLAISESFYSLEEFNEYWNSSYSLEKTTGTGSEIRYYLGLEDNTINWEIDNFEDKSNVEDNVAYKDGDLILDKVQKENSYALEFDGVNDYVDLDVSSNFNNLDGSNNPITMMAWAKPYDFQDNRAGIFVRGTSRRTELSLGARDNEFELAFHSNARYYREDFKEVDNWHHLAMTYSEEEGRAKFYLDGELFYETSSSGSIRSGQGEAYIGWWPYSSNDEFFEGVIDDLRVYSQFMKEEDIQKIYRGKDIYQDNLLTHWSLEEGSGNTIYNQENSMTGNLVNNPSWVNVEEYDSGRWVSNNKSFNTSHTLKNSSITVEKDEFMDVEVRFLIDVEGSGEYEESTKWVELENGDNLLDISDLGTNIKGESFKVEINKETSYRNEYPKVLSMKTEFIDFNEFEKEEALDKFFTQGEIISEKQFLVKYELLREDTDIDTKLEDSYFLINYYE